MLLPVDQRQGEAPGDRSSILGQGLPGCLGKHLLQKRIQVIAGGIIELVHGLGIVQPLLKQHLGAAADGGGGTVQVQGGNGHIQRNSGVRGVAVPADVAGKAADKALPNHLPRGILRHTVRPQGGLTQQVRACLLQLTCLQSGKEVFRPVIGLPGLNKHHALGIRLIKGCKNTHSGAKTGSKGADSGSKIGQDPSDLHRVLLRFGKGVRYGAIYPYTIPFFREKVNFPRWECTMMLATFPGTCYDDRIRSIWAQGILPARRIFMKKGFWQPALGLLAVLLCAGLILGGWFWYDTAVDRSGWVDRGGVAYYKDYHGQPVTGWQQIAGKTYYFRQDSTCHTGFLETPEGSYFFDEAGVMHTGALELEGQHYLFGEDGCMVTGWHREAATCRYFGETGVMHTGWLEEGGSTYYFRPDGSLCTGRLRLPEGSYYFDAEGRLHTGWLEDDEGRSYYGPDGLLQTGWLEEDGKTYLLDEQGYAVTGWVEEGQYRRYFMADGAMAVSPTLIDGQVYYFTPKGYHVILVNYNHFVPEDYTVELVYLTRYFAVDTSAYGDLVRMLEDCLASGNVYIYNSGYRTHQEQWWILQTRTKEYMDTGLSYQQARSKALLSVAYPGTSEHELGLAVDLLGAGALEWLSEHCWEYGFILRYPPEKTDITRIIYEPWHFRYVGVEISMDMKDTGLCLEEYLQADKEPIADEAAPAA